MKNKRNKFLAIGITLCMLFAMAVVPAHAAVVNSGTCGDNLTWTLDYEGTLTISGTGDMKFSDYNRPWSTSLSSIKSVIIQNGVTSIGIGAFSGCNNLNNVIIPDSVTSIWDSAFYNCSSMNNITIPNSVKLIDVCAFSGCTSLTSVNITDINAWCNIRFCDASANPLYNAKNLYINGEPISNLVIPKGVTYIGESVFCNCSSLTSVTIPNSVKNINGGAFYGCKTLSSITIPDSVTSIGSSAFEGCSSLTSITIPSSVKNINDYAFYGCSSLSSITISDSATSIGSSAFDGTAWYDNQSEGIVFIDKCVYKYKGNMPQKTNIVLNSGTKSIAGSAFANCSGLTSITIPDSVISIGDSAFYGCSRLTSVNITDITAWCNIKFGNCFANPIYYTHNLYINDELVTSIVLPDSVTSIGHDAFYGCKTLSSITIPDSVISIGSSAFEGCSSLTTVNITDITAWCNIKFGNYFANPIYYTHNLYINDELVTSIVLPDSVTSIGRYAFYGCKTLSSITIPDSVISIGDSAFEGCSSLTDVYYRGTENDWDIITIGSGNYYLLCSTMCYNCILLNKLTVPCDNSGETITLTEGNLLDTGENLNFRNGYVDATNGYVKVGDKKITGSNIYFNNDGKIRMDAGYNAKIEKDNGNGTKDQGFIIGVYNPTGIITMILEATGTVNDVDYTGRTRTESFDFTDCEIGGLANIGFVIINVPRPLKLEIKSVE